VIDPLHVSRYGGFCSVCYLFLGGQEGRYRQVTARTLPKAETQEIKDSHPSGQALGDPMHQPEVLGTGYPVSTRLTIIIDAHLDIGQEGGGVLNLVDKERRRIPLQEKRWIFIGQCPQGQIIERDMPAFLAAEMLEQCGFSNLPGSCYQDYGELFRCLCDTLFQCSGKIQDRPSFVGYFII
jgi:hypothetical protein